MNKEKSIYQYGAENGLFFGLYLSAIFLIFVYAGASFFLNSLGIILMAAVPLVIFRFLRLYYRQHAQTATFGSLWILGVITFLCGALICSIVTYLWLEYVIPGFILEQAQAALAVYEQVPELKDNEFTVLLRKAIENKMLPTPIQFVVQMLWFTISAGILSSIFIAILARLLPLRKQGDKDKKQLN